MKQNRKYIAWLVGLFLVLVIVEWLAPTPLRWDLSLLRRGKQPFDTYVLHDLLPDLFPAHAVQTGSETVYELFHETEEDRRGNLLSLSERFYLDSLETGTLLEWVGAGNTAFIAAADVGGELADTLDLDLEMSAFTLPQEGKLVDTIALHLEGRGMPTTDFHYRQYYHFAHFTSYDTARTTVLARNEAQEPVLIRLVWGEGAFLLSSTPAAFTNYHLLNPNVGYAEAALSYLPVQDVFWTEYYQTGRQEPQTPLRFILRQPPLRAAYFITMGALLLFIAFEAKRRQRIIPVVEPPRNRSVEFAETLAQLYLRRGHPADIARKKLLFWREHLHQHYRLSTDLAPDEWVHRLAELSGHDAKALRRLLQWENHLQAVQPFSSDDLLQLNKELEAFQKAEKQGPLRESKR
ncbi:hypothetical protein SAMN05421823_10555 [Catalinimonas alkaloidigena]|uniref:DUF4350 domain-containing protein n=1 Tax=Catalinimonas alkaloidigena TaxID=1075417 RepID=A0A1G9INH5_9BACT|nr:DUF4350 domain-containing protein [Catalinimonas alkaloidigena]SDL26655.1 hypothetical protein SAMN05421823_10555 [Catalinimonas alkaloidigena]